MSSLDLWIFLLGGNMRKFEKISYEQFKKDISEDQNLYESYTLPVRSTKKRDSYDIKS